VTDQRRKASRAKPRLTLSALHTRIEGLLKEARRIANPGGRVRGREINEWLSQVQRVLALPSLRLTHILERFSKLKFRYHVLDEEVAEVSGSAYRDLESDRLMDFDFGKLQQVAGMLDVARETVELQLPKPRTRRPSKTKQQKTQPKSPTAEVNIPASPSPSKNPKAVPFDRARLLRARDVHNLTQEQAAKWFRVSKRHYIRWERGETPRMHRPAHGCYDLFLKCAEHGLSLPAQCDTQMSLSPVTHMTR